MITVKSFRSSYTYMGCFSFDTTLDRKDGSEMPVKVLVGTESYARSVGWLNDRGGGTSCSILEVEFEGDSITEDELEELRERASEKLAYR